MAGSAPEDKPIPLWQKIGVGLLALALLLWAVLYWHRFLEDFWPFDRSFVGPNLVAAVVQYSVLATLAVFLYPPWRRAAHRFVDRKLEPVHEHLTAIRAHHETAKAERDEIHRKLDHIIKHSSEIPDLPAREEGASSFVVCALALIALALLAAVGLVVANHEAIWRWMVAVSGAQNESGHWYGWWSGSGADLGELTLVTAVSVGVWTGVRKANCGAKGCWRIGHHNYEMDGVTHHLCRKHHPLHPGKPVTHAQILEHHQRKGAT